VQPKVLSSRSEAYSEGQEPGSLSPERPRMLELGRRVSERARVVADEDRSVWLGMGLHGSRSMTHF